MPATGGTGFSSGVSKNCDSGTWHEVSSFGKNPNPQSGAHIKELIMVRGDTPGARRVTLRDSSAPSGR